MSQPDHAPPESKRLESWKEIAEYLGKGVTTVRRREREEGLPVRRMEHVKRGSVVAYQSELDAWINSRTTPLTEASAPEGPPRPATRLWLPLAAGAVLLTGAGLVGLIARQPSEGPLEVRSVSLTSDPGVERSPSLSPDGNRVVYEVSTEGIGNGLFIKPVSGGESVRLTSANGEDAFPLWSPDGSTILFTRIEAGPWLDLMTIPAKGGEAKLLLRRQRPSTPSANWQWASWMPDSRSILLIDRSGPNEPWAVYRYSPDSGSRVRLTSPPAATFGDLVAAASPDGKRLAFSRFQSGTESDIYVMDARPGSEVLRLTWDASFHTGIAWEPGGKWLVYSTTRLGSGPGLWRIQARHGALAEPVPGAESDANWPSSNVSASQLRIAYQQAFEAVNLRRWDSPNTSGSEPRNLSTASRYERAAQYSPDGTLIAFSSTSSTRRGSREIWVCDSEGNRNRQVTWMNRPFADSPRWSPDGTRIAFSNTDEGDNRDIYVANAQGGGSPPRRLTSEPSEEGRPSWSRDGKWIYFRSNRTGTDQIWKKAADGSGEAMAVTIAGGYEPFESPDGRWLYFAKDRGHEGLWRISTAGGSEEQIAAQVREGLWSITNDGCYFIRLLPKPGLWRLRFGEREPSLVAFIAVPVGGIRSGFSARVDGRSFLWPQTSSYVSDVMMLQVKGK